MLTYEQLHARIQMGYSFVDTWPVKSRIDISVCMPSMEHGIDVIVIITLTARVGPGNSKGGSIVCFANKNKICELSYSWFQISQTGGQQYSDTSPFRIPWFDYCQ